MHTKWFNYLAIYLLIAITPLSASLSSVCAINIENDQAIIVLDSGSVWQAYEEVPWSIGDRISVEKNKPYLHNLTLDTKLNADELDPSDEGVKATFSNLWWGTWIYRLIYQ